MDIRYFEFLDRLKRGLDETRQTNASVTQLVEDRPFKPEVGGSIPSGGTRGPMMLMSKDLWEDIVAWDEEHRKRVKMVFVVDEFDKNQGVATCPCGAQFEDWATLRHTCPECGATDEDV